MLSSLQRPWPLRLLSSRRQLMPAPVEAGSGVAASALVAVDLAARASVVWVAASAVAQGSPLAASAVAEVWVASVALLAARGLLSVVKVELVPSQLVASVLPWAALAGAGTPAIEAATTADGATGTELPG
jgi:hypothetical protein